MEVPDFDPNGRMINPADMGSATLLRSNSIYLNDPRLRDWIATECLRKHGRDINHYGSVMDMMQIRSELIDQDEVNRLFKLARAKDPAIDFWFSERYMPSYDWRELQELSRGTLGREYYEMLMEAGLTPDFIHFEEPKSDYDYWMRRYMMVHDIEHVVTGYRYDAIGEIAYLTLHAVNAQTYLGHELAKHVNAFALLLVTTSLSRYALHYPRLLASTLQAMGECQKIGAEMKPIFIQRFEDMFEMDIEDVRKELGIVLPEGKEDTRWCIDNFYEDVPSPSELQTQDALKAV